MHEHPRLLLRSGEERQILLLAEKDSTAADVIRFIDACSDSLLGLPPVERQMEGRRLLGTSREALRRIFCLSTTWRLTGEDAYARRATDELMAICRYKDWNPGHFLDTGEMALAAAIGYDWLWQKMTSRQRDSVRMAIITNAFVPSADSTLNSFYETPNNWNEVCIGSLGTAALAIKDDCGEGDIPIPAASPDSVLQKCLESNYWGLGTYSPEGIYPEGYGYWSYGTSFEVILLEAMRSALGTDKGLADNYPGFMASGKFIKFMETPAGRCFSFYDTSPRAAFHPVLPFFGLDPGKFSGRAAEGRLLPIYLILKAKHSGMQDGRNLGNYFFGRGKTPLYIYRSGWDSPCDTYLGVKGGAASDSHGHIDGGSFFFEQDSVLWAADLGGEQYGPLEKTGSVSLWDMSQGSTRWDVFRPGPLSHNILTLDGHRPDVKARVKLVQALRPGVSSQFSDSLRARGAVAAAEVFLGGFLREDATAASRTVWLGGDGTLHVTDRFTPRQDTTMSRWAMCTEARPTAQPDGSILLEKDGRKRTVTVTSSGTGVQTFIFPAEGAHMVGFLTRHEGETPQTIDITIR